MKINLNKIFIFVFFYLFVVIFMLAQEKNLNPKEKNLNPKENLDYKKKYSKNENFGAKFDIQIFNPEIKDKESKIIQIEEDKKTKEMLDILDFREEIKFLYTPKNSDSKKTLEMKKILRETELVLDAQKISFLILIEHFSVLTNIKIEIDSETYLNLEKTCIDVFPTKVSVGRAFAPIFEINNLLYFFTEDSIYITKQ